MEYWLWAITGTLFTIIILLCLKIYLLQKAAREIGDKFAEKLITDTNTLIDISSRDRHMRKLAEDINTQLCILRSKQLCFQQGNQEVRDAITNISHDLRTPLTAVCGYLDLLKQTKDPEVVSRYLDIIENRVEVLKQRMEELFRYSAITSVLAKTAPEHTLSQDADSKNSSSSHFVFEDVSFNSALEEILSAYYASLKSRKITPKIIMPDRNIIRRLNRNALFRILENIISNAIKYSDGDLNIILSESGKITFSNHAKGLDELQVMQLFNRFYTVETAAKSTGIGLSIAKELTERMHGTILAKYQDGMLCITVSFDSV